MIIISAKHFPPGSYTAINLFGIVMSKVKLSPQEVNHERIHTAQMREMLFVPFYVWYVVEWLVLLCRLRNPFRAYCAIRFEREAYDNQADLSYLRHRRPFACFRRSTMNP